MPEWLTFSPAWLSDDCNHAGFWEYGEIDGHQSRVCGNCMLTEIQDALILNQPDLRCPKCDAVIPTNLDREIALLRSKLHREPTEAEINQIPGNRRKMGLMGCEACAVAASPPKPKEKKPVGDDPRQRRIEELL